jgi:hypothetical protein
MKMKGSIKLVIHVPDGQYSRSVTLLSATLLSILLSAFLGCAKQTQEQYITTRLDEFQKKPKIRIGSLASPFIGTKYIDCEKLGKHSYKNGILENNGIVFTCRAGHIDIAHVRNNADWTAHFAAMVYDHLRKNHTSFDFNAQGDSIYHVELEYPEYWDRYPLLAKYRTMKEVSIRLGQYFTYIAGIWHEVLTWFGYKSSGFYPEFHSAFSWEDTFSNVLGTQIGVQAIRDNFHSYDEAVTIMLQNQLQKLEPQPPDVAKEVTEQLRGQWFSNRIFYIEMRKRNFDIGLVDGYVTPITLPFACGSKDTTPMKIKAPSADFLDDYGFTMKFEIEPKEWEKDKILDVTYPDPEHREECIDPRVHLIRILEYIEQSAAEKYGKNVTAP